MNRKTLLTRRHIAKDFEVPVGLLANKMGVERTQLLEFVTRMREAEEQARIRERDGLYMQSQWWRARALAFNEVYTELKGSGFGRKGGL